MTRRSLDEQLRALAAALAEREPPVATDRAIAAAIAARKLRAAGKSTRPAAFERWLAWALREAARAFVPIASADEIALAADAYVLPARLPRMSLAQLGLPVDPERIGEAVDTELLVRPDGAVLALRFVN